MRGEAAFAEVRRELAAAPEKVFAAFANPTLVSRWLTPSPEVRLEVLAFDFRVGGLYRFAYQVPDGPPMIVNGVYRAITPPSGLVFSWNIEPPDEHAGLQSEVIVAIAPTATGSQLHIRHRQLTLPGSLARHSGGWHGAIDRLVALLESHA